ncbi:MAG: TonB-dependent receptor, partial [Emcibacter sp.]|nr:TonB-dependent receptor [Emcibacter sp.]
LSEDFNVEVIADYFRADDAWGVVHQLGGGRPDIVTLAETLGSIPSNLRNVVSGIDSNRFVRVWGLQSTASWDMTEDWTLRSITAYRETRYTSRDELVGNPSQAELTQLEQQHQFSEELQVMASGSNWDFILGGYYFTEEVEGFVHIPLFFAPGGDFDQSGVGDTKAYAAFAHGSIEIVDKLSLVLGARYSHEKRASTGAFDVVFHVTPTGGEKSFNSFTPKATLQFEPNENMMVYAGVSKGSKSGGFTIGVPGPGVEPETLWSYEVGLKAEFFDRRLTTNLSAFYYDYKDLVVTRVVGAQTLNENAAAATIKGIEAEIVVRPIDNLRIDVTLGLLDPKYDSYNTPDPVRPELGILDLSGNRLAGTSNYTARIGIQYDVPLDNGAMITLDGDVFFSGDMYFSPYQQKNAYQAAYETYNASLTYQSDSFWSVTAWGRNLSNAIIISNQFVSSDFWGFPKFTYLRNPRTYGVNLQVNF